MKSMGLSYLRSTAKRLSLQECSIFAGSLDATKTTNPNHRFLSSQINSTSSLCWQQIKLLVAPALDRATTCWRRWPKWLPPIAQTQNPSRRLHLGCQSPWNLRVTDMILWYLLNLVTRTRACFCYYTYIYVYMYVYTYIIYIYIIHV